jgi:tripartite-type tricarboxylate transporter receptor subunit TctC
VRDNPDALEPDVLKRIHSGWLPVLIAAVFAASCPAHAEYPDKPLRLIVPFPPGGGTDILVRAIGPKLTETWGQPVVVDNRGGANGMIGAAFAAKAPPDGQTILAVPAGYAVNPSIYANLPYNPEKDLAPVTQIATSPMILVVHPSLPVKSVRELIALARIRPGQINYATSGNGSPPHLAAEYFKTMAGVKLVHIPYKGPSAAMIDLMSGQISLYFMNMQTALPHVKSGKLRALAVTSPTRFPAVPELPTMAEAGVPGYEMTNWYALLVPGGTPKDIIAKINAEVVRILNSPAIRERLASEGAIVVGSTPEQFAAFLKQEMAKFAKIVKASGMTATD